MDDSGDEEREGNNRFELGFGMRVSHAKVSGNYLLHLFSGFTVLVQEITPSIQGPNVVAMTQIIVPTRE